MNVNFLLPNFAFAHRSLTVRSPFSVRLRSLLTKRSSFAHRAFSYRSKNVHRSPIILKAFSHFHSELQRERIVLKPSVQNSDKIRKKREGNVGENFLCISEISLLSTKRQDYIAINCENSDKNQFVTNSKFHNRP